MSFYENDEVTVVFRAVVINEKEWARAAAHQIFCTLDFLERFYLATLYLASPTTCQPSQKTTTCQTYNLPTLQLANPTTCQLYNLPTLQLANQTKNLQPANQGKRLQLANPTTCQPNQKFTTCQHAFKKTRIN